MFVFGGFCDDFESLRAEPVFDVLFAQRVCLELFELRESVIHKLPPERALQKSGL